jgi:cytochrome c-type biogenesis protein CcmI
MTYVAAVMIVAAVALFVAAPLTEGLRRGRRESVGRLEIDRLEHDRGLAMQGLRELEFDHEMGKLDPADYQQLRAALENRAFAAMSALDRAGQNRAVRRSTTADTVTALPSSASRAANSCPQCGATIVSGQDFCSECGAKLGRLSDHPANGSAQSKIAPAQSKIVAAQSK